uniref:Uncharacterized protein n=1 Tax=Ditylenchus dipsaci TaxID=166011 RepID=A0A915EAT1_9BILA
MSEQIQFEQQEEDSSVSSIGDLVVEDSGHNSSEDEGSNSWSVVQNSSSEQGSDEEEEDQEEEHTSQSVDDQQSYSIEGGSVDRDEESDQNEGYENQEDEQGSEHSNSSESSSSISLEDASITSFNLSSSEEYNLKKDSDINSEPHVNKIPAPSFTISNTSNIAVYTTSVSSQSTSHATSSNSVQAVPSSTAPSVSEGLDNQEQTPEQVRQELSHKIKAAINSEETTASSDPQEEESEAVKFWKAVGQRQFNALMAAKIQSELKQKVIKALGSDVIMGSVSEVDVKRSPVQQPKWKLQPLGYAEEDDDLVGKRYCLVCSTGQVRIVPVNAGRNKRWQCVDCMEWYEWCPVVHPVSPKRARLLETGGWDENELPSKKQTTIPEPVVQQKKPCASQKLVQTSQQTINVKSNTIGPVKTVEENKPVNPSQKVTAAMDKPGFSNSKTLLFLLAGLWLVLVFVLGYFFCKYSAEVKTSANLLREVQHLKIQLRAITDHIQPTPDYPEYSCFRLKPTVPITFKGKLWLLLSTVFGFVYDNSGVLRSTIENQLKNYNALDAFLLIFTLVGVCGASLVALTKTAKLAFKCGVYVFTKLISAE